MVKKQSNVCIKIEIIESSNRHHRYVLSKQWSNKPMVTVLTLYPSSSNLVEDDMTMMLITNNVYKLGYGGFYSVNLFSKYEIDRKNYLKATNVDNDDHILECAKKSCKIIFAYGSLPLKNKQVAHRLNELYHLLLNNQLDDKITYLTDEQKELCFHPLASQVRKKWYNISKKGVFLTMKNNESVTIRDIKENIFYVFKYQSKLKDGHYGEKQVRKVRVGIFDKKSDYFYKRLLACIIILKHSREFQKFHSDIFEDIIKEIDFPDSLNNLQNIDNYMKFTRNNIDDIEISSKPIVYLLFILISFYNLNDLLNDFYLIFNRTFTYEKQQLEIQSWDSLIKDDFLLNMLIFGLDELKSSATSQEYFESLQDKYIEKQMLYHQTINDRELSVSSQLYRSIDVEKFLIKEEDKIILENNKLFDYLNKMTDEEREDTEKLILSLFVFEVSDKLKQAIANRSIQWKWITDKKISLREALDESRKAGFNHLNEYQTLQPLEQIYRYIDEDIATTFADKNISCKLEPLFQ